MKFLLVSKLHWTLVHTAPPPLVVAVAVVVVVSGVVVVVEVVVAEKICFLNRLE